MTKSDEGETYASTTASPPPVKISLDDSIESDYKDSQFMNGGGLISPNTDFSEEVCASFTILVQKLTTQADSLPNSLEHDFPCLHGLSTGLSLP